MAYTPEAPSSSDEWEWGSEPGIDEDDENDLEDPKDTEIKESIESALWSVNYTGDFGCFHYTDQDYLNLGLHINQLGRVVSLPLSAEDAAAVVGVCRRSPFGKGTQTLVDTSVRCCWELNANDFKVEAPGWEGRMKTIVTDISKGLGIAHKADLIKADPYKLLLYEEGAFFLSHQDSPKAPGMFGTLIVCLPTKHEGGEVVLKHDRRCLVFSSAPMSRAGVSYGAWFSDVFHEIKPVLAGHRLVLTYNLIFEGTSEAPIAPGSSIGTISDALQLWNSRRTDNDGPSMLLYKLSYMYTDSDLSLQQLKGKDCQRIIELQAACQTSGFTLYLGNVERHVCGECKDYQGGGGYYEIYETVEDFSELTKVVDHKGNVICPKVCIESSDFVQRHVLEGMPTDEDYSGYTGNEGISVSHIYRKTVAIIVPKSCDISFRLRGMPPSQEKYLSVWLKDLLTGLENPENIQCREDFVDIAKAVLKHNKKYTKASYTFEGRYSDKVLSTLSQGLHLLKNVKGFLKSIMLHANFIQPAVYPHIAEALAGKRYSVVENVLFTIVSKAGTKAEKVTIIDGLVTACLALPGDKQDGWDELLEWKKKKLVALIPSLDGRANWPQLVRIAELYPELETLSLIINIKPPRGGNGTQLCCLAHLGDSYTKGKLAFKEFPAFYRSSFDSMMANLDMNYSVLIYQGLPFTGSIYVTESGDLVNIYKQCQTFGVSLPTFQDRIIRSFEACHTTDHTFTKILTPFLQAMISSPSSGEIRRFEIKFVLRILSGYILKYVQLKSDATSSWTRSTRSPCGCTDCEKLNAFLQHPSIQTEHFPMSKQRCHHLYVILNKDSTISHETLHQGNPHTLIVKKLGNPMDWWKTRAKTAIAKINSICSATEMESYLGSDAYKSLIALDIVVEGGSVDDYVKDEVRGGRKRAATSELDRAEAE